MSLERIKDTIISDARKEVESIIENAKERLREMIVREKIKLEELLEEKYAKVSKKLEEDKNRELTSQRTNYKMKILDIKNNMIEDVFEKASDKFVSNNEEYKRIMERWFQGINGPGCIHVNSRDFVHINQGIIGKNLKKNKLEVDREVIDIKGGFILKTAKYEVDHTLDSILGNLRIELTPIIARELFGGII